MIGAGSVFKIAAITSLFVSPANGNFNAFAKDYEQLAAEVVELDLHPIAIADLKMEDNERAGNEFPIAVLNVLQWLMVEGNVG